MSLESPDMGTVKECLQGAGLYEESMEKNDMIQYYNVLKSSESTATEEKKRRQQSSNAEDLDRIDVVESPPAQSTPRFKPATWSSTRKQLDFPDPTNNNNNKEIPKKQESPRRDSGENSNSNSTHDEANSKEVLLRESFKMKKMFEKLNSIDVYTCKKKSCVIMKPVVGKPKFAGPVYCRESLSKLSLHEKVVKITDYHNKLARAQYELQRKSLKFAELPGSIQPSQNFTGDLERRKGSETDVPIPDLTYTSRSGRAVKRKMYAEGFSSEDEEPAARNGKEETAKAAKKTKSVIDDFEIGKPKEDTPKGIKKNKSYSKKLTNEEIMSKSGLFADSPGGEGKGRVDRMFDKLKEEQSKAKKGTEFQASLDRIELANDDDYDLKITSSQNFVPTAPMGGCVESSEDTVTKLRVVPPMNGRRGYKRTQALIPVQEVIRKPDNNVTSRPSNKVITLSEEVELIKKFSPNKKDVKKKVQHCPICNQVFARKDIEDHASTCGLTSELEIENDLPTTTTAQKNGETLKCDICEQEFLLNTFYEVHVKDCIQKHS